MVKPTSRSSYYQHVIEGKAKTQREQILDCLENSKPLTRLQISDITGIRLTSVCGRVTSLIENNQVSVDHEGIDPATNRPAEYLKQNLFRRLFVEREIEEMKEYPVELPDLGDDDERLAAVNDYFGEQYTDWSQITWEQLKWFLTTALLHKEIAKERDTKQ